MKSIIPISILIFLFSVSSIAQEKKNENEMKTYTFVMLKRGENTSQDAREKATIQKKHMEYIGFMADSGHLNVAGPFMDDGFWRGILIFNSTDTVKIRQMVEKDPAVMAGRLTFEMHPWLTQRGTTFK